MAHNRVGVLFIGSDRLLVGGSASRSGHCVLGFNRRVSFGAQPAAKGGRNVKEEQERLHDLTVRASTASRRGEQARQALSTVEATQAAEGHVHDRLENELDSLRRKERQLSHGLAAVRAELSELQEPEVAEERARLLELLSLVFSEVAHGR